MKKSSGMYKIGSRIGKGKSGGKFVHKKGMSRKSGKHKKGSREGKGKSSGKSGTNMSGRHKKGSRRRLSELPELAAERERAVDAGLELIKATLDNRRWQMFVKGLCMKGMCGEDKTDEVLRVPGFTAGSSEESPDS